MAENSASKTGRVAGKTALVTGGASGIGRAVALVLAREGARVAVADLDEAGAGGAAAGVTAEGGTAAPYRLDVTAEDDWKAATDRLVAGWGRLDVAVNCAGISFARPVRKTSLTEWRRVLAVNLDGVFLGTRAAILAMRRTKQGSIINIASAAARKPIPGTGAY